MPTAVLLRAAALGAASGARSATPLAALARGHGRWPAVVTAAAALGELVADKLPTTPSRLQPAPLTGRIVLGAVAAGITARRHGAGVVLPALIGAAAAAAGSYAGAAWRKWAAERDLAVPAALLEDAAAVLVATSAARP